jgi:putative ABC transport system permease protein
LVICGSVAGLAGALIVTRFIRALLFGVPPHDPATFSAVVLLLVAVTVVAALVPARRAIRVDPAVALREE